MKKILMVLVASMALAACGENSRQSEANRNEDEMETNEPSVNDEDMDDETNMGTDTTMNNGADTTDINSPGVGATPSR